MPRLTGNRLPKYRKHASGQAVITIDGREIYLGPHGTKASHQEYDLVIAEWIGNGRTLPGSSAQAGLSVNQLAVRYMKFANGYYRKNGKPTASIDGIRIALRFLCKSHGRTAARDFGPLALAAIRNTMIEADHARVYINKNVDRIRQAFKWAVSQELVPVAVHQGLTTLPGLRRGRTAARETAPVLPVSLIEQMEYESVDTATTVAHWVEFHEAILEASRVLETSLLTVSGERTAAQLAERTGQSLKYVYEGLAFSFRKGRIARRFARRSDSEGFAWHYSLVTGAHAT